MNSYPRPRKRITIEIYMFAALVDILWKKLEKKISREWPELEVYSEESSCLFFAVNSSTWAAST